MMPPFARGAVPRNAGCQGIRDAIIVNYWIGYNLYRIP
ncbi:hypothetical protein RSPO_m00723 (plasmid) [Ralstonia solanacearum Po82]|uniref:Uncharacterized protein n=1 Tax=Ralstonia solanacearum (strain Po82) TaxID=1031711 RepID=F6G9Z3_RALS8|nr:hypothetical protein RSPO_m00723 [Ralstonia solanacearum Po82]